ncbi:MAG: flagellar protein FlaG, partial [Gammaproteobacteria bacterium]|nr:flagellar protein FlaG [Gammaproteobacteria bacterium]
AGQPRRQVSDNVRNAGAEQAREPTSPSASVVSAPVESVELVEVELQDVKAAVENLREFVTDMKRELQFSVDEDSGRTIITVIDSDSGKIIRQIPPEEVLQLARSAAEGAFNLIDRRA